MQTANAYAGIGSRNTPTQILTLMEDLGRKLAKTGIALRSGGAAGADQAFWVGHRCITKYNMEIYLPWAGFQNHDPSWPGMIVAPKLPNWPEAMDIAAKHHPAWHRCTPAAKVFHSRNVYQVLGHDLQSPARFVLCWTPEGIGGGGTGQALRIARTHDVPVYDLAKSEHLATAQQYLVAPEEEAA